MIARAWLTEAAEHSIDVQYFIFSADNVGLIAVDYMLRAADRGVRRESVRRRRGLRRARGASS